jgi:undecaprenyl phosphate N,N'-diacetylbacillosamine 1-phosphate transferase
MLQRVDGVCPMKKSRYSSYGKCIIDIVISGIALLVLCPLFVLIVAAIRITMGRPVLFRQPRPGLNEQTFTILKFRTTVDRRDASGELLCDAMRVTGLGKFLRATSLDELPELWNIVRRDMSLVGPRPLLTEYLPYYSAEQRRRHALRPGLTGLAQVTGRNHTTWDERLGQDIIYVDNCTFMLDCKIIARTLAAVFHGDGGTGAIEKLGRFRGSGKVSGSCVAGEAGMSHE